MGGISSIPFYPPEQTYLDVVGRGERVEVPAGPPRGRLAVDLVDEVVGQHVVVAAVMVLCGRGVGRHRQEQHYSQHLLFVLDRLGRKNESSGRTAGSMNHKQLRRFLNSESERRPAQLRARNVQPASRRHRLGRLRQTRWRRRIFSFPNCHLVSQHLGFINFSQRMTMDGRETGDND